MTPTPAELRDRLDGLTGRDRHRIGRRLARARAEGDLRAVAREIDAGERLVATRAASLPAITYPEALPVSARREEILEAIRDNQVVVVAGETGSGKTTQLPKMCLELGRGVRGVIGHTQPRRIAARTVAERLADELGVDLGGPVGYAVRFDDRASDATLVKVMTDGILLAEIQRDRMLSAYDTVIVDEAHERSLNIDFLLGYLTQLLPRRPDLKVIITSATIDTARFAGHFSAPVVEVTGRTYPVEVRYRPVVADDDDRGRDQGQAICDAVAELCGEGPGDVLVFLAGERDIRDAADALRTSGPEGLDILPLYARLSTAEQHRVFRPHAGRRVVLATNVAETSLTVPGIRYVVDTGTARISRYSHRTKVQRLPIEAVSQASANQRAGRCGRVAPGVCIRLYSEEDFAARPEFTDPEILRTNLASVILQMTAIGLGDIEAFPFVEPPDRRSVADGVALLEELGAFAGPSDRPQAQRGRRGRGDGRHDDRTGDGTPRLSTVGRRLAQLPLDPRLGRMVLEAETRDCLREVTVIAAALSIQDPRERPADKAQAADEAHRRFVVPDSDFLGYVKLWDYLAEQQASLSGNQFRKQCRAEYLNVLRVREWQDLAGQIRQVYRAQGVRPNREPATADQIHQALLAGLLSLIGMRDKVRGDYLGARNARWQIGRGSSLARRQPAWAMAGALVETERTWARTVARIEPAWAERLGAHLVKRSFGDPWWDAERGEAVADERVTLYGLPVVAARRVSWSRIDPAEARAMFIQAALVEGDWRGSDAVLARTRQRIEEIRRLEERVRRRDLLAGDAPRAAFYDERIPEHVTGARSFERWWRTARAEDPEVLDVPMALLVDPAAGPVDVRAWPDEWRQGELRLPLRYRYAPGDGDDGVTVSIPLVALSQVRATGFDWHVPGLRRELITALLRSLPRPLRRHFVPVSEAADEILAACGPGDGPLLEVVARQLARRSGEPISADLWDLGRLPDHLRMTFEVVDGGGRLVGRGRDLAELQRRLRVQTRAAIAAASPSLVRHGATSWVFGDLPRRIDADGAHGYPSLVDEGDAVGVSVLDTPGAQADHMWRGTRRLLLLGTPLPAAHLQRRLTNATKLALARWSEPLPDVLADCAGAAVDDVITAGGGPAFTAAGFARLAATASATVPERVVGLATIAGGIVAGAERVEERAAFLESRDRSGVLSAALADVRHQLDGLVHPGFVASCGTAHLGDVLRYMEAAAHRLDRLPGDAARDARRMASVQRVQRRYDDLVDLVVEGLAPPAVMAGLAGVRWMLEELRVSLFAQTLGTPVPVSEERITRALDAMTVSA